MKKDHPQVMVRIRPSESTSELRYHLNTVTMPSSTYDRKEKTYEYHCVFDPSVDNHKIWEDAIQGELTAVAEGRNLTLLAYGVTGSGKTHTIFGNER